MKIDPQLTMLTSNFEPFERETESGFDQLLDSPVKERTDDDYYWQHQNQLQQSALTFNPLASKARSPIIISDDAAITQEAPRVIVTTNAEITHASIALDRYLPESTTPSELEVLQLFATIKTTLEPKGNPPEGEITDQSTAKNTSKHVMSNQTLLPNALFKNYQLYLNDNSVELTLNTAQLSKHQANELQKLIKQWLTKKGYSLKQLIINGVQQ